jgi:hypothetical protein
VTSLALPAPLIATTRFPGEFVLPRDDSHIRPAALYTILRAAENSWLPVSFPPHPLGDSAPVVNCPYSQDSAFKNILLGGVFMAATGELIRMMNYVDDISATLRRIVASKGFISDDEKKKLADYMRNSNPNYAKLVDELEKGV